MNKVFFIIFLQCALFLNLLLVNDAHAEWWKDNIAVKNAAYIYNEYVTSSLNKNNKVLVFGLVVKVGEYRNWRGKGSPFVNFASVSDKFFQARLKQFDSLDIANLMMKDVLVVYCDDFKSDEFKVMGSCVPFGVKRYNDWLWWTADEKIKKEVLK